MYFLKLYLSLASKPEKNAFDESEESILMDSQLSPCM
jgi:hypothetical protein